MRIVIALLLLAVVAAGQEAPRDELQQRVEAACAELARGLEAYLGPKFEGPVPVRVVDKEFFGDFMARMTKEFVPDGLFEVAQELAIRLKQLPPGFDLIAMQQKMIESAVAGLYDPMANCFYVARSMGQPGNPMFQITAAHELVHAYRDVDKPFWEWTLALIHEDMDWAEAVRFLVEGDATLVGFGVGATPAGSDADIAMEKVAGRARVMAATIKAGSNAQLAEFPFVLREQLASAYADGLVFAAKVYQHGGKEALDAAYDRPPRSTEQVLHPEKFLGPEPDEPVYFEGGDPTAALGEGWKLALANVMGEFEVRVHLTEKLGYDRAAAAAAGWDGSRYFFCRKEGVPSFFGMVSTWDSEADAEEFAAAWCEWSAQRDGQAREVFSGKTDRLVLTNDGLVAVRVSGRDVLVADGAPPDRVRAVFATMAGAQRRVRAADAVPARIDR